MPRTSTLRSNYDDLKSLNLADLKRYGLMVPMHRYSTTIRWTRSSSGVVTGTIAIAVSLLQTEGFIELDYTYRDQELMNYQIALVQMPSNLGQGVVWYFVCPLTGERCRKLYQAGKYFASRKALPDTLYETQTYSKKDRWYDQVWAVPLKLDNAMDDLYERNVKRHYRGKPTRRLRRVMKLYAKMPGQQRPFRLEEYTTGRK